MSVILYNTMTRKKEELKPRDPNKIGIYVCGPTTYNLIHLGNARPMVFFDTVRRYLEYKGFEVFYVQNFTDIDDKIIQKAREKYVQPHELAEKYIEEFFCDASALKVRKADLHPRVSEHIPDILQVIQSLIEKGFAYQAGGNVYYDVSKFKSYGKLSGRSPDEMRAGARVEVDHLKGDPLDFVLWKAAKEGEPSWPSPWGDGRPGWHIECSTMSVKYLGAGFDIHGGGLDLIFPHHENEIAQAEAYLGSTFVNYWLHNGFITVNKEKMSKSLGNFFLVREILKTYPGDLIRFYLLSTHYRHPLDFDEQKLQDSLKGLKRLQNAYHLLKATRQQLEKESEPAVTSASIIPEMEEYLKKARQSFQEAMDNDLNTALAISSLFDFCRESNSLLNRNSGRFSPEDLPVLRKAEELLKELGGTVLGILEEEREENQEEVISGKMMVMDDLVELVLRIREDARRRKEYAKADLLRQLLVKEGIILQDNPQGTRWQKTSPGANIKPLLKAVLDFRGQMRKQRDWEMSDKIRVEFQKMGLELEDTAAGTRIKTQH